MTAALLTLSGLLPPLSASGAPVPGGRPRSVGVVTTVFPNPSVSLGFGATVAVSGTTAVVDDAVFTRHDDTWPTTPTVVLDESGEVAMSDSTIVVGSSNAGTSNEGEAYIYGRERGGWPTTPTVVLDDPGATAGDGFGTTVAISGSTLVIGTLPASGPDQGGQVYVYARDGAGWPTTPTAVLTPPPGDRFRAALAVSGHTALVGGFDASANAKVAFIYTDSGDGWTAAPTAVLDDPTANATDCYGEAVGISGRTAVVGDWCTSWGRVYVYREGRNGWPALPATTLGPNDRFSAGLKEFGLTLSISADTLIVGAPGTELDTGEVYIFRKVSADAWPTVPTAALPDPAASRGDRMGVSLAVSGALAIAGAPGTPRKHHPNVSGVAYLFGT
jgi:hypothetical protein